MTKDDERKKIVEAFEDDNVSLEGFVEKLKEVGFEVEQSAVESKSKKKANI